MRGNTLTFVFRGLLAVSYYDGAILLEEIIVLKIDFRRW